MVCDAMSYFATLSCASLSCARLLLYCSFYFRKETVSWFSKEDGLLCKTEVTGCISHAIYLGLVAKT